MDEENVQSGIDWRDDNQDKGGGTHDPFAPIRQITSHCSKCIGTQILTLALEILLETFKRDISRSADDQDSEEALHITTETLILTQEDENRLHEVPKKSDWDE